MATSHGEYLKSRGNTPTKPVKGGKAKEESIDDFCRLCGVNFKVKFGNFQKSTRYLSTENLFKPSGRAKRDGKTLAEICSEIGLNIVESSLVSSRVCQSCGRKIFNAAELFHFIRIIYYDWHMYSPRPISFPAHWCAGYSKYRGFLAGGISNASSPLLFFGSRLRRQNFNHTIHNTASCAG